MDHKKRVSGAMNRYLEKESKKLEPRPKRNNQKPEKAVVESCMFWLKQKGFDVHVVESKAVFNPKAGRYLSSQLVPGFSDICGNDSNGRAVFIECKAPGRRSTLREVQFKFLSNKIHSSAFAVVVDSHELLETYYSKWISLSGSEAREYLASVLPKCHSPGIDDDFPW